MSRVSVTVAAVPAVNELGLAASVQEGGGSVLTVTDVGGGWARPSAIVAVTE